MTPDEYQRLKQDFLDYLWQPENITEDEVKEITGLTILEIKERIRQMMARSRLQEWLNEGISNYIATGIFYTKKRNSYRDFGQTQDEPTD